LSGADVLQNATTPYVNSNTSSTSSSNSTLRSLQALVKQGAINWNADRAASLALRQAILDNLLGPAAAAMGTFSSATTSATTNDAASDAAGEKAPPKGPILDQVLVASCFTYDYASRSGVLEIFNDTSPVNTYGNVYPNTDALVTALDSFFDPAAAAAAAPTSGAPQPPKRRRRLAVEGSASAASAAASGPWSASVNAAMKRYALDHQPVVERRLTAATAAARALALELQPGKAVQPPPGGAGKVQFLTFNLIAGTSGVATAMKGKLAKGSASVLAINSALALSVGNATGMALSASVDSDSVKLITLTFTRSFWGIFLQWLWDNIMNVLAGSCSLICFTLLMACFNRIKRYRQQRHAEAKETRLQGILKGIQRQHRKSFRGMRLRRALLAYLRKAIRERQGLRPRAGAGAPEVKMGRLGLDPEAIKRSAAAALSTFKEGGARSFTGGSMASTGSEPKSTPRFQARPSLKVPPSPTLGGGGSPATAVAASAAKNREEAAAKSRKGLAAVEAAVAGEGARPLKAVSALKAAAGTVMSAVSAIKVAKLTSMDARARLKKLGGAPPPSEEKLSTLASGGTGLVSTSNPATYTQTTMSPFATDDERTSSR